MDQIKLLDGISVVIPVYNSAEILPDLIARLEPVLDACSAKYEAILVEDGSRDDSWGEIERLSESNTWVRGIRMMRNYGQHNALLCGLRAALFTCTVTIDDDLQHPPEEIPLLLEKISEGYDVVYGTPTKQQHGLWRNLASYTTRLALQSAMGIEIARKVSAFRAIRTQVRQAFAHYQSPFVVLDVLLGWGTTRFASATTQHLPRQSGKSNYTFSKLIQHGVNMLTGFSVLPLQMASLMGFTFAFFGILIFFYVIGRFIIEGGSVPGFPFLASIIAIFSGVQLFAIGIIGEYLARMHFRIMERPPYVVREETDNQVND